MALAVVLALTFAIAVAMSIAPPKEAILDGADSPEIYPGDMAWMICASAMVLIMTPGIAFFYGGMSSSRNMIATISTAILPMSIVLMMWTVLGFSLAFGDSVGGGILGSPATYGLMYNVGAAVWPGTHMTTAMFFTFQGTFAMVTPAVIIGAIADRCSFSALAVFIPLWHIIVYCPVTHMVWTSGGVIAAWGLQDFAGGMVVHMSAGYSALAAAYFLGPAKVRGTSMANVVYIVIGTALLWFGWIGFNGGSAFGANAIAAHAIVNTNVATAFSMFTWMLCDQMKGGLFKTSGLCLGIVVGLVVITPAAGYVNVGEAAVIGMVGSGLSYLATWYMESRGREHADDTLDVFACHGIGGSVGMVLTALLQSKAAGAGHDGVFYGNFSELYKCAAVQAGLISWYLLSTYTLMWFTNLFITCRVSEEEEALGLDKSRHGDKMDMAFLSTSRPSTMSMNIMAVRGPLGHEEGV
ncbi:hypothetical protein FOA52_015557 [Chlamydomonas sp. UWO 241]|nr:hypothetical protein FOA52_015557 [Chlamydomonas sp. UWO 241]